MNSNPTDTPPCATWDIWVGPEIEGHTSKGVRTLFIRSLAKFPHALPTDDFSFFRERSNCTRVWFCKEFTDWKLMRAISRIFDETCIEVEPKNLLGIPKSLRRKARLYVKLKLEEALKPGDHICVGLPYADEAFEIGKGAKVTPEQYLGDIKIV